MSLSHFRVGHKDGPPDFFLATTCTSGRPCANYVMALMDTATHLAALGKSFEYWLHTEDCHVDDARNFICRQFLNSKAPFLIFIDDDVGWEVDTFVKLISWKNVDIVGAAYPLRQQNEEYPVRIDGSKEFIQAREDGLVEVHGVPTGFMRINRNVIEKMAEKRKHMEYRGNGHGDDEPKSIVLFERMNVDGKRWSGDLNFCREARNLGFKIFIDMEATFSHQGNKMWEGNLGVWLRRKQGIVDPNLDQAVLELIEGNESPEVFDRIWKYNRNQYSMGPEGFRAVYKAAKEAKGPILEVGAGITSILAGIAVQRTGQMVWSLEHDLDWWCAMRSALELWKVRSVALVHANIQEYGDREFKWYEIDPSLPKEFAVAIIDGPPRKYGREGVYKLMLDRIKDATWIVDDVDDPTQLEMVQHYAKKCNKLVTEHGVKVKGSRRFAVAVNNPAQETEDDGTTEEPDVGRASCQRLYG